MKILLVICVVVSCCGSARAADDKDGAEGSIRSPRAGEEVERSFTAKGRTKNVPDGQVVILFRPVGESGFLFPLTESIKGNRSFSEQIHHEPKDEGTQVIQVRILAAEVAKKVVIFRRAILKWYQGGGVGPRPSLAPGLLESSVRVAEVEYELGKSK